MLIALLPQVVLAHGVRLSARSGTEAVTGLARYADGSPVVDARVQLARRDPASNTLLITEIRSDMDGRFAFPAPRTADEFRISVDDGLGHRGEIIVTSTAAAWQRHRYSVPSPRLATVGEWFGMPPWSIRSGSLVVIAAWNEAPRMMKPCT